MVRRASRVLSASPWRLYQGTPLAPHRPRTSPATPSAPRSTRRDLDGDGYADIVVGTPGENQGTGSFAVVRGGRDGLADALSAAFGFNDRGVPGDPRAGRRLGAGVAIVPDPDGDGVAVAVTVPGADRLEDAVLLFRRGAGAFAPGEVEASRLDWDVVASPRLERPAAHSAGTLLKIARIGRRAVRSPRDGAAAPATVGDAGRAGRAARGRAARHPAAGLSRR